MNFTQETIEQAIDQLFSQRLLPVEPESLKIFKSYLILECTSIEGDKLAAENEVHHQNYLIKMAWLESQLVKEEDDRQWIAA